MFIYNLILECLPFREALHLKPPKKYLPAVALEDIWLETRRSKHNSQ